MAGSYIFKPMKGLTFWTLLMIGLRLAALAAFGVCDAVQVLTRTRTNMADPDNMLAVATLLAALLYFLTYFVSGIVSLVWIYGATRNALAIRPGLNVSPGWAVGWFFVPIANLFKPYQYLADVWRGSAAPGTGREPPPWMMGWWVLNIIGGALINIGMRLEDDATAAGETTDLWLQGAGFALVFISTYLFFRLVRNIHRNQLLAHSGISTAEVF